MTNSGPTIVVCFPGLSKYAECCRIFGDQYTIMDDSIYYWKNRRFFGPIKNKDWPNNYISAIREAELKNHEIDREYAESHSGETRKSCIFVNWRPKICEYLHNAKLSYIIVTPQPTMLMNAMIVCRYAEMAPISLLNDIANNYDDYVKSMINDQHANSIIITTPRTFDTWVHLL